jgi:hypothetical protein
VVGFEADQVRKGAGANGEDVSVPINVAYNHHYAATLLGEGSRMERVRYDPKDPRTTLFTPEPGWDFIPVEHTPSPNGLPTNVWAGYSNGGEFRKTYKGLAPPYAQVLESPTSFSFQPMQIDTWNRDKMNLTGAVQDRTWDTSSCVCHLTAVPVLRRGPRRQPFRSWPAPQKSHPRALAERIRRCNQVAEWVPRPGERHRRDLFRAARVPGPAQDWNLGPSAPMVSVCASP